VENQQKEIIVPSLRNLVEDEERMRQWVIFPGWGQCFDITDWLTGSTSSLQKNCATYPERFSSKTAEESGLGRNAVNAFI